MRYMRFRLIALTITICMFAYIWFLGEDDVGKNGRIASLLVVGSVAFTFLFAISYAIICLKTPPAQPSKSPQGQTGKN